MREYCREKNEASKKVESGDGDVKTIHFVRNMKIYKKEVVEKNREFKNRENSA